MTNPLMGPSALRDIVDPQFHQNNFPEELYIKNELNIRLDKGMAPALCLFASSLTYNPFKTIKFAV
jgi:hypothetical protein